MHIFALLESGGALSENAAAQISLITSPPKIQDPFLVRSTGGCMVWRISQVQIFLGIFQSGRNLLYLDHGFIKHMCKKNTKDIRTFTVGQCSKISLKKLLKFCN
eukprot:14331138-Ditylum_brightwellii.AAC.1